MELNFEQNTSSIDSPSLKKGQKFSNLYKENGLGQKF